MMIADLVDQDDFRERLTELGVALAADLSPEQCVAEALQWHGLQPQPETRLAELFNALLKHADLLLPEVKQAVERGLAQL